MRHITTLINRIPVLARVTRERVSAIGAHCLPRRPSGLPRHGRKVAQRRSRPGSTIGFLMLGSVPTWSGILPSFPIDHFLLYKLKSPTGAAKLVPPLGVELADQFETREVVVAKEDLLGVPTDKNGEGTLDDLTHLLAYSTSDERGQAKHVRRTVSVTNQFGSVRLRTTVAKRLMVPASKGLATFLPAPDPLANAVDHYRCYGVAVAKGERFQKIERVHVADQFQDKRIDVLKPFMLCNPAEKRWAGAVEPIKNPEDHLLCYRVRPSKGEPRHTPTNVFLTDQFGQLGRSTVKETELCVPSSKVILDPPPPPTPTPVPTATPTPQCGNGIVEGGEECDGGSHCTSGCTFIPYDLGIACCFGGLLGPSCVDDAPFGSACITVVGGSKVIGASCETTPDPCPGGPGTCPGICDVGATFPAISVCCQGPGSCYDSTASSSADLAGEAFFCGISFPEPGTLVAGVCEAGVTCVNAP